MEAGGLLAHPGRGRDPGARDASNVRNRMRQAGFPVAGRLQEFDVASSWIPPATFEYLIWLEWTAPRRTSA